MDNSKIISKVNTYLHEASKNLVIWLENILPRVTETWWQDCVMSSLSYTQKEIAKQKGFSKLSDFDLAALLRIANKSWYDMRTVEYLPTRERECIREMIYVRNNWAHCSAELPGKDTILHDLGIIHEFMMQVNGEESICRDIKNLIEYIEQPDSIKTNANSSRKADTYEPGGIAGGKKEITEKSLVYLVSTPEKKGIVLSVSNIGETTRYEVFVDGSAQTYYSGQIELVEENAGYNWVDADTFRSYLTAYQINNPSARNLYSLNSARIDFVPYQFRPALKLIHADEPRILIADSVGVGKTIEAGLIIKELEARGNLERVLIICPKPLVVEEKWELEMKRFDEEFTPLDGAKLRQAISDTHRDGEWPIRHSKVIIPYSILDSQVYNGGNDKRSKTFGLIDLIPPPHFDLVIIDEAHHIRNGSMEKDKAFAYKCTKYFCDHADAVVMLTATPLQTGDNDLFTLLNALRPDVVIDQETFTTMSRPNEYISKCAHIIRAAGESWEENAMQELLNVRKTQWGDNVISENPLYSDILQRLESGIPTREDRVKLISDVESLHSFNTMINRTRRKDIQDFCVRRSHTIEVPFTDEQRELHDELLSFEYSALSTLHNARSIPFMMSMLKRQAASCIFGLAPNIRDIIARRFKQINDDPEIEFEELDIDCASIGALSTLAQRVLDLADSLSDNDPKFDEMMEIIWEKQKMPNNKIMLFSTFRHTLAYLKKKLLEQGFRVEQVDGSMNPKLRPKMKERFELPKENPKAIDILLFTEVGSEGLDYQFCDMMINYDLPWNPMRIEQRIGRIDRRGQKSESVNIYNMITEGTVDSEIYHRCLMRIGIFEKSIGECEEILGEIASKIEKIAVDTTLTEEERGKKLEQMADNEVRKVQELNRLEEEEKELFGFDLSEFTTAQEIRRAENPWLTQQNIQCLINQYLTKRVGTGYFILGESGIKTLRLSASARGVIYDDAARLPGRRNALRRDWEYYLNGKVPNHSITFDSDAADKDRDSFFITALHPFAKQAATYFTTKDPVYLYLEYYSDIIPAGTYIFSIYAWKYLGLKNYSRLVTVCNNEVIAEELPDILQHAISIQNVPGASSFDWSTLEEQHVKMWISAREKHRIDMHTTMTFKQESLANNHRNRVIVLERQINDATDESIYRMRMSELETVQESFKKKIANLEASAVKSDIHTALLANGVITIKEG